MSMFDTRCMCNKFRSLSFLSPVAPRYGVFNRLIPDAALSALVDNLRIFTSIMSSLHKKRSFPFQDFFSKCDQIRCFLRICPRLLNKSVMENFIFCAEHLVDLLKWSLVYHRLFSLFLLLLVFPQIRYFIFFPKNYTIVSIPKCSPSFIILFWYFPNKIFTVPLRL